MNATQASKILTDDFGIDIGEYEAQEALDRLATYSDLRFETLEGKFKVDNGCYRLLAVINNEPHNGSWQRYVDFLKANYDTVIIEAVTNYRLCAWLLRNDFTRTKKSKENLIWRNK